jgi:hypothetical protein
MSKLLYMQFSSALAIQSLLLARHALFAIAAASTYL